MRKQLQLQHIELYCIAQKFYDFIAKGMQSEHHSNCQSQKVQQGRNMEALFFQQLKQQYNENSFILIGPPNSFFSGSLALQFANLTLEDQHQKSQSQQSNNQVKYEATKTISSLTQKKNHVFQSTITNKPIYAANQIICIDDSEDPHLQQSKIIPKTSKKLFQLPLFQKDRIYYTPTFASQCTKLTNNQYYTQFMNKVKDYRREVGRDWIMQPRPRSKYMYCAICKDHYEEYLGHINSRRHLDSYQKNKFTRYITSLELTINTGRFKKEKQIQEKRKATFEKKRQEKEQNKNAKKKRNKKDSSSSQQSESSSDQPQGQDMKKVKKRQSSSSPEQNSRDKPRQRTRDKKNQHLGVVKRGRRGRPKKCKEEQPQICKKE